MQRLVGLAGLVAGADAVQRPALAAGARCRPCVVDAVLGPRQREPCVEDPAGVKRGRGAIDHRQRRDRREARRPRRRDEQLADAAVGDPRHPDLVVGHPRLARDGLDDVVAVEALERLEEVERAARAPGSAHVDVDHGVAEHVGDRGDRALAPGRVGVPVARVLDQRRVRPRAGRQVHDGCKLRPVAHREIAVARALDLLAVELGGRRRRAVRQHLEGTRPADPIPGAGLHAAEHGAAERAGALGGNRAPAAVVQRQPRPRLGARDVDLLDAPPHAHGRSCGGRHRGERERCEQRDQRESPVHAVTLACGASWDIL